MDPRSKSAQTGFTVRSLPTATALAFEALLINRIWPRNPVNWHYRCYGFDHDKPAEVEQPAGAFLMFRRDAWVHVGGFDERYGSYYEEVDLCHRLWLAGHRVGFAKYAQVSTKGSSSRSAEALKHGNHGSLRFRKRSAKLVQDP